MLRLADCARDAGKDSAKLSGCIAGEVGSIPAAIAACLASAGSSTAHIQDCLAKTDGRFADAQKMSTCVQGVTSIRSRCYGCAAVALCPTIRRTSLCAYWQKAATQGSSCGCGALPSNVSEVVETVTCIQGSGSDLNRLSECLVETGPITAPLSKRRCA